MFKVCISDSAYQRLISAEERKSTAGRSNLYKLLMQQPVQLLTASDNERYKAHPEDVLRNPSALYILDMTYSEALAIQKTYGVMCMSSDCSDISPLIDVNGIHVTVVFDDMSKHKSYSFDEIATKINRIKTKLRRDYPIMMEVLGIAPDSSIYNKLHNRLIISNYYLVEAGHKLAAFKVLKSKDSPMTFEDNNNNVNSIAFSSDGKKLVTCYGCFSGDSCKKNIKLIDVSTGAVILTLSGHDDCINEVRVSPNDRLLASASGDNTVKIWKIPNLQGLIKKFIAPPKNERSII